MRNTDEAIAAAWSVICTHPVERRPDWVASNLLRSVDYHAFVRPTRRRLSHELVEPSAMDVAVEPEELTDDPLTAILGALRLAGASALDASDARLIAALLRCDQLAEAARELDVSAADGAQPPRRDDPSPARRPGRLITHMSAAAGRLASGATTGARAG